jgi:type 1 glutamine amidotransferase
MRVRCLRFASYLTVALCLVAALPAKSKPPRKIVLIAGKKSHGPGEHEYLKSVRLLKVLLDRAPNLHGIKTEIYFDGWPQDAAALDSADSIVLISDGMEWHPLTDSEGRIGVIQKQIDRGCGFMTLHFSTYVTAQYSKQALEWNGGFFNYDGDPAQRSDLKTLEADIILPSPKHPITRGVSAYRYKDEFYYKMNLLPGGDITSIVRVPALSSVPDEQTVAWAFQRKSGGRSVGMTFGHYYENWRLDDYRKLILNAMVWTAHGKVPAGGVKSSFAEDGEVEKALGRLK